MTGRKKDGGVGERQGQESRKNNVEGDIEKQKRWTKSKSKCMFQKRRRETLTRRVRLEKERPTEDEKAGTGKENITTWSREKNAFMDIQLILQIQTQTNTA